ncbi:Mpv17/PMP22 family protein [Pseudomonas putida]|uniref:Mpv17/PMP22 family protein n=1 Tax=Pseudomonas putida TaxID=303 RepID=UPI0039E081BB
MSTATALSKVKRGWWGEVMYRANWLFFGGLAAIVLAFIPVIGWIMSVGIVGAMLWKVFGFREEQTVGSCPACTVGLRIDPKKDDVISCPTCSSVIKVHDDCLALVDLNR